MGDLTSVRVKILKIRTCKASQNEAEHQYKDTYLYIIHDMYICDKDMTIILLHIPIIYVIYYCMLLSYVI